ncbi:MAG: SDR family oxidoreductase [Spirochaetales bacterium]|nr:SDR family oxidoreductase [Spirochaetales bacterium]
MERLREKKAIITGGASGIGFEIASRFLQEGADILIAGRTESRLYDAQKKLCSDHKRVLCFKVDIASEALVKNMFHFALEEWGRVDVLVNNAGAMRINKSLTDTTWNEWTSVIDTNINGTFLCCREAAGIMKKQRFGRIINISSMSGYIANRYFHVGSYEVSKSAHSMLTKVFALELAEYGITVNAIAPGYYDTQPNRDFFQNNADLRNRINEMIPKGKLGNIEELGHLATYLSSDVVEYLTGQTIIIDGGYTIW